MSEEDEARKTRDKIRDAMRAVLVKRVNRLLRLAKAGSPDSLLASEARLIGEAGWMLDPESLAAHEIVRRQMMARRMGGFCVYDERCPRRADTAADLCREHAAMVEAENAALDAELAAETRATSILCGGPDDDQ